MTEHTPCIEWTGYIDDDGYGRLSVDGKWRGAHRVAWEKDHGKIPYGMVIDHLCRNRACVNVDHLEVVTSAENTKRGIQATKPDCLRGHPLSDENLIIGTDGRRRCRQCARDQWRSYRLRKMEAGTWTRR